MPAAGGAKVEGADRLRRTIKAAGGDLGDFTKLNREVANIVLPAVKAATPSGPDIGGHIVSTVRAGATRNAAIIRVGNARMPYGPVNHWGWYARHIKPNPWVSRAAQETEPAWTARYFDGLVQIIQKIQGAES